jgi:hypothetical protein
VAWDAVPESMVEYIDPDFVLCRVQSRSKIRLTTRSWYTEMEMRDGAAAAAARDTRAQALASPTRPTYMWSTRIAARCRHGSMPGGYGWAGNRPSVGTSLALSAAHIVAPERLGPLSATIHHSSTATHSLALSAAALCSILSRFPRLAAHEEARFHTGTSRLARRLPARSRRLW